MILCDHDGDSDHDAVHDAVHDHDHDHDHDVDDGDAKLGCSEEETAFSSFVMEEEDEDMFDPVRFNCIHIWY